MGLFNMFKSDSGEKMTAHKAFACALIYCMGSDGEMDPEEVGHLLSVLGGSRDGDSIGVGANNKALLDSALKYVRKVQFETFLTEATPVLTPAQRLCVLTNMVDSAMSDGEAEQEEQVLIGKAQQAFGISDEQFRPFFEVIIMKNDRSVFTNPNHPHNQAGYQVKLSGVN
jgi:uncharacterized tellurite resistance protein B-like protein